MINRKEFVKSRINELYVYLGEWEEYLLIARDPAEIRKAEATQKRIKSYIDLYDKELIGQGKKVEEDINNPLTRPAEIAKQINKKWLRGIVAFLLLSLLGIVMYQELTSVEPDYTNYLAHVEKGNQLLENQKFKEAQEAFEQAARYFPGDTAVQKKLDLLKQGNRKVVEQKFEEARSLFKLVLEIPSTSEVAFENKYGIPKADQMQITIEWASDNSLVMTISGGTPYDNTRAPYHLKGLDCRDCVTWESEEGGGYRAVVNATFTFNINLVTVIDSRGRKSSTSVPDRPERIVSTAPPVNEKEEIEEPVPQRNLDPDEEETKAAEFKGLVEKADKLFDVRDFQAALKSYQAAKDINSKDQHVNQRIRACEEQIAKAIPRKSIVGGTFSMGYNNGFLEEKPVHQVNLKRFKISTSEVTVEQYRKFCRYTERDMPAPPSYGWHADYPMVNVSWYDALAFCKWVGGRLPTEAEWEYVATDAGTTKYSGGNVLEQVAVFASNANNEPKGVRAKRANSFDLYDLTGNVQEWCADWYGTYSDSISTNPVGPENGTKKVIRGGAYNSTPNSTHDGDQLRSTYRNSRTPSTRSPYLGFRVAW